jgi:hypothetical protein
LKVRLSTSVGPTPQDEPIGRSGSHSDESRPRPRPPPGSSVPAGPSRRCRSKTVEVGRRGRRRRDGRSVITSTHRTGRHSSGSGSELAQVVIPPDPTGTNQSALNGMPSRPDLPRPYWTGLSGRSAVTKQKAGCWTRRRAFAQVRKGPNIQLLPYPLVSPKQQGWGSFAASSETQVRPLACLGRPIAADVLGGSVCVEAQHQLVDRSSTAQGRVTAKSCQAPSTPFRGLVVRFVSSCVVVMRLAQDAHAPPSGAAAGPGPIG